MAVATGCHRPHTAAVLRRVGGTRRGGETALQHSAVCAPWLFAGSAAPRAAISGVMLLERHALHQCRAIPPRLRIQVSVPVHAMLEQHALIDKVVFCPGYKCSYT